MTADIPNPNDKELSTFRRALPQFVAVGVKNLVLFGYGMTLGFPTIFIPAFDGGDGRETSNEESFTLTKEQISWLSSINLLCVPLGCFLSGALTEPTGKRKAMQLVNIPMFVSWLLFYFSTNINYMYAGLCLAGLSGGLMEAPVLTYVAEVTQPEFRGMLAATGTTCVISGIFLQFIMGSFMKWRTVALCSSVLPIITCASLCFVPESPYWLLTKGRLNEAKNSLSWLRGWVPFEKVEPEFNAISKVLEGKRNEAEAWKRMPFYKRWEPFTKRGFIAPFILVSSTFLIGHFSGKTPLQTYAVQIFHTLKAPIDKYYATILLGAAELIGAFTCVLLVHKTGKRPLVFTSLIGTGICFCATAFYARYLDVIPGVSVDNIVANHSIPLSERGQFITEKNLTEIIRQYEINGNSSMHETTTLEFESSTAYTTTTEYTDATTAEPQSTTYRSKRMNVPNSYNNSVIDETNLNQVILPIKNANELLWLPLSLLLLGALFAHLGIRIIPWMLIGEVFPVNVRSAASGLSSGLGYIFAFLANKLFLQMLATLTLPGTFWFYSAVAFIGCVLLFFFLPETENRTLLDIEEHFLGRKLLSDFTEKTANNNGNLNISRQENGSNVHNNNNSNTLNRFDVITVTQSVNLRNQPKILPSLDQNGQSQTINETNENKAMRAARLSVPEIIISHSGAGSKRYKNRIVSRRNSCASNYSEASVQDTHL